MTSITITRRPGGVAIITAPSDFAPTTPNLTVAFDAVTNENRYLVVLDMSAIQHLGEDGLNTLVTWSETCAANGGGLYLACASPAVMTYVLNSPTNLSEMYRTVDDALFMATLSDPATTRDGEPGAPVPDWLADAWNEAEAEYANNVKTRSATAERHAQIVNERLAALGITPATPASAVGTYAGAATIIAPWAGAEWGTETDETWGVTAAYDPGTDTVTLAGIDPHRAETAPRVAGPLTSVHDVVRVMRRGVPAPAPAPADWAQEAETHLRAIQSSTYDNPGDPESMALIVGLLAVAEQLRILNDRTVPAAQSEGD